MAPADTRHIPIYDPISVTKEFVVIFLDSENKEDLVDLWKLRLGGFIAFVRYIVTTFHFISYIGALFDS
jgi:hypothetical protein